MTHHSEHLPHNAGGTTEPILDATLREVSKNDEVKATSDRTNHGYYYTEEGQKELRIVAKFALIVEELQGKSSPEDEITNI